MKQSTLIIIGVILILLIGGLSGYIGYKAAQKNCPSIGIPINKIDTLSYVNLLHAQKKVLDTVKYALDSTKKALVSIKVRYNTLLKNINQRPQVVVNNTTDQDSLIQIINDLLFNSDYTWIQIDSLKFLTDYLYGIADSLQSQNSKLQLIVSNLNTQLLGYSGKKTINVPVWYAGVQATYFDKFGYGPAAMFVRKVYSLGGSIDVINKGVQATILIRF